jgi:hypothetical protein
LGEIDIGETIKNNIDYWKNLYFEEREKRNDTEEKLKIAVAMLIRGTYPEQNKGDNDFDKYFISRDKIKEKYLEMEQEYAKKVYDNKYDRTEVKKEEMYKRQVYEELLEEK